MTGSQYLVYGLGMTPEQQLREDLDTSSCSNHGVADRDCAVCRMDAAVGRLLDPIPKLEWHTEPDDNYTKGGTFVVVREQEGTPDESVEFIEPDADGLYPIGNFGWCWNEEN